MKNFSSKTGFVLKILVIVFISLPLVGACRRDRSTLNTCLPKSRQLTDVIVAEDSGNNLKTVTISDKLRELQASCPNNRLVDAKGTEIVFSDRLQSCGGAGFNQEILQQRRKELETLQQKYTVIIVECNNNGIPIP
ncbi:hypothetical protein [Calothrix sp. CCY 0018]|uniref:hypothetical protein n=1 Tax=Calothrix sp. CCY 0018 TaxID=3103864 RepID=UPI0039C70697